MINKYLSRDDQLVYDTSLYLTKYKGVITEKDNSPRHFYVEIQGEIYDWDENGYKYDSVTSWKLQNLNDTTMIDEGDSVFKLDSANYFFVKKGLKWFKIQYSNFELKD
ncbi:hypothetical protein [Flammeovirga sp. OC4]|uniref:hypothetical protein n=1 Tax=Flammeovirga sp. OC4 TaxID=1382345 RepID=UPI0005C508A7|nr:hypothetical protein [Flammeovirga sp. OC4]